MTAALTADELDMILSVFIAVAWTAAIASAVILLARTRRRRRALRAVAAPAPAVAAPAPGAVATPVEAAPAPASPSVSPTPSSPQPPTAHAGAQHAATGWSLEDAEAVANLAPALEAATARRARLEALARVVNPPGCTPPVVAFDVQVDELHVDAIVIGLDGIFCFEVRDASYTIADAAHASAAALAVERLVNDPRYAVTGAVVTFSDQQPRRWYDATGAGGWAVGLGQLAEWTRELAQSDRHGLLPHVPRALAAHLAPAASPQAQPIERRLRPPARG